MALRRSGRRVRATRSEVTAAHRRIDGLLARTAATLRADRGEAATRRSFARVRQALDAHFAQEDRLYYPPIWSLRPDLEAVLGALIAAHDRFRAELAALGTLVDRGARTDAAAALASLQEEFTEHERREEEILRSLEKDLQADRLVAHDAVQASAMPEAGTAERSNGAAAGRLVPIPTNERTRPAPIPGTHPQGRSCDG
jgi:hypothetical protein